MDEKVALFSLKEIRLKGIVYLKMKEGCKLTIYF